MEKPVTIHGQPLKELRRRTGMNQTEFWARVGVGQRVGSRYEVAGRIPLKIGLLIQLIYIEEVDISRIRKSDWLVIQYLNEKKTDLLALLKQRARKDRVPEISCPHKQTFRAS